MDYASSVTREILEVFCKACVSAFKEYVIYYICSVTRSKNEYWNSLYIFIIIGLCDCEVSRDRSSRQASSNLQL